MRFNALTSEIRGGYKSIQKTLEKYRENDLKEDGKDKEKMMKIRKQVIQDKMMLRDAMEIIC